MMDRMMDGMGMMMWGAGLLWLLLIVILVLAAAALIKYLRSDKTRSTCFRDGWRAPIRASIRSRTCSTISVATRGSVFIRKWVLPFGP